METYKANYAVVERSVSYKGAREWNNLSVQDRNIQTYGTFKLEPLDYMQKVKEWLIPWLLWKLTDNSFTQNVRF